MNECLIIAPSQLDSKNCFLCHFKDVNNPAKEEYGHILEKRNSGGSIINKDGYFNNKALSLSGDNGYSYKSNDPIITGDFTLEYISQIGNVDSYYGYNEIILTNNLNPNANRTPNTFYFSYTYGHGNLTCWLTTSDNTTLIAGDIPNYSSLHGRCHTALVRKGDTFSIYVDGVRLYQVTSSKDFTPNSFFIKAHLRYSSFYDEFRLLPLAVYVNNFNPPTKELEKV